MDDDILYLLGIPDPYALYSYCLTQKLIHEQLLSLLDFVPYFTVLLIVWFYNPSRLCTRHGATSTRSRAIPDQLPERPQGTGALDHMLDVVTLRSLGRHAAVRAVSQAPHDRGKLQPHSVIALNRNNQSKQSI